MNHVDLLDEDADFGLENFLKEHETFSRKFEPKSEPAPDQESKLEPALEAAPEPARTGPTGPRTPEGKAISSLNNLKHGLAGAFRVLLPESQAEFDAAHDALIAEHEPATATEFELVRRMAEHAWLYRRAQQFVELAFVEGDDKKFALYLRYQTTHDHGFRACLNDLLRLRRERRQEQKQFESQSRAAEVHAPRVRLANARAASLEFANELKSHVEAPLPGYSSIPVEQVKELFQSAMLSLRAQNTAEIAA